MSEAGNFNRLIRLYLKGSTTFLLRVLDKYSGPQGFSAYIYANQGDVLNINLFDQELRLVMNRQIDKMDITLLSKLAFGLFQRNMTAREKQSIKEVREKRNELLHSDHLENAKIDELLFNQKWAEMSVLLENAAKEVGPPEFVKHTQDFITDTKQSCPELAEVYEELKKCCLSNKKLEEKVDRLTASAWDVAVKAAIIQKNQASNRRFESLKDKFMANFKYSTSHTVYHTKQLETALKHLLEDKTVTLYGRAGEGKSTTAMELVKCLVEKKAIDLNKCVMLFEPDDIKEVESSEVDLILLDDMFGKHSAEANKLTVWRNYFETLQSFVSANGIRIISCNRMHVYMQCKTDVEGLALFSKTVELNSAELSPDIKRNILLLKLSAESRTIEEEDIEYCISQKESDVGFPLIAAQFATDENTFNKKSDYFSRPYRYYIEQNVKQLDRYSLVALWYVFYRKNHLHVSDINVTKMNKELFDIIVHIAALHGIDKSATVLAKAISTKINHLMGSYLRIVDNFISFIHETLYEAIASILAEEFPSEVVKYCTAEFLCQCVQLGSDQAEGKLIICEDNYDDLVKRVVDEVIENNNGQRLSQHSCLGSDKFVFKLLSFICESESTFRSFFSNGLSFRADGIHGFLYHTIENQKENHNFIKRVIPYLRCEHVEHSSVCCWQEQVKSEALTNIRCHEGNTKNLSQILINEGARETKLLFFNLLRKKHIADSDLEAFIASFSLSGPAISINKKLILQMAMRMPNKNTMLSMIYERLTAHDFEPMLSEAAFCCEVFTVICLMSAGEKQFDQMVLMIQKISKVARCWRHDAFLISYALAKAWINQLHSRINMMISLDFAKWTEAAVYWAVKEGDYSSVVGILKILHENETLDSESSYLAWAMALAIKHQDQRIYNCLKETGIVPSTAFILALVEFGQSDKLIQSAITECEQMGNWDGGDMNISKAYMIARERNRTTLTAILETCGAGVCPATLPLVVNDIKELERVLQILKHSGLLDPLNKYIARATIMRLGSEPPYNNPELNMACLLFIVEKGSADDLLHVVSVLKTNNVWDPECDYALEALNLANKQLDKRNYQLLLEEGVQWRYRNLPLAVQFETVYGLKQVLKQMKEKQLLDYGHEDIKRGHTMAKSLKNQRKFELLVEYLSV